MLYGREAPLVAADPSPHFQLATEGMMFSTGSDVLYTMRGWVCRRPLQCASAVYKSTWQKWRVCTQ
jgi:hypothetical protein